MYIKANVNKIKPTRKFLKFWISLDAAYSPKQRRAHSIILMFTGVRVRHQLHVM